LKLPVICCRSVIVPIGNASISLLSLIERILYFCFELKSVLRDVAQRIAPVCEKRDKLVMTSEPLPVVYRYPRRIGKKNYTS